MMNRTMNQNCSAVLSSFAFNAVGYFGVLRYYFYYFFLFMFSSKRKLVW